MPHIKYFKYLRRGKKEIKTPSPTQPAVDSHKACWQRAGSRGSPAGISQRSRVRSSPFPIPAPERGTHRAQHRTAAAAGARARSYSRTRRRAAPPAPAPAPALPLGPRGSRGSRCPLAACSARGKGCSGAAAMFLPRGDAGLGDGCGARPAVLGMDAGLGDGCWARPERCRCSLPPNRPDCHGTLVFMAPAPSPGSAFPQFKAHLLVTSSQRSSAGGAGVEMLIAKSFHKNSFYAGLKLIF